MAGQGYILQGTWATAESARDITSRSKTSGKTGRAMSKPGEGSVQQAEESSVASIDDRLPRMCVCVNTVSDTQRLVILESQQVLSPQTQDTTKNMVKRHRKIKALTRGYPAGNWQSHDSNLERHLPQGPSPETFQLVYNLGSVPPGTLTSQRSPPDGWQTCGYPEHSSA